MYEHAFQWWSVVNAWYMCMIHYSGRQSPWYTCTHSLISTEVKNKTSSSVTTIILAIQPFYSKIKYTVTFFTLRRHMHHKTMNAKQKFIIFLRNKGKNLIFRKSVLYFDLTVNKHTQPA